MLKSFLKQLLPPILADLYRKTRPHIRFRGTYDTWEAAKRKSAGYQSPEILQNVLRAALEVQAGRACYERDARLFYQESPHFPLLSALHQAKNGDTLRIIDFGGSLGSSFFQNRRMLREIPRLEWHIVDQPEVVRAGRENLHDPQLFFHETIAEALAAAGGGIELILFSSVLQYLEKPQDILREAAATGADYLYIEKTPLANGNEERIAVQTVPKILYPASYPVRVLPANFLPKELDRSYRLIEAGMEMEYALRFEQPEEIFYGCRQLWKKKETL